MAETMDVLQERCEVMRADFLAMGQKILALKDHGCYEFVQNFPGQHLEMKANTMLAYRHLEDVRMRFGKVIQQIQGGTSIYDHPVEAES